MASAKQADFLYYNLDIPHELAKSMTVDEASAAIDAYRKAMQAPFMERHRLKGRLRNKVIGKGNCLICQKPLKPLNSPKSCSC